MREIEPPDEIVGAVWFCAFQLTQIAVKVFVHRLGLHALEFLFILLQLLERIAEAGGFGIHPPLGGCIRTREAKQVAHLLIGLEGTDLVGDDPFAEVEAAGEDFQAEFLFRIAALGVMEFLPFILNHCQVVGVISQLGAVEPDGMAADVVVQAVAAAEVHLQVRQLGDVVNGVNEFAALGLEGINAQFVVHEQTEPKTEAADFDGLLLDVHTKKAALDEVFLGFLFPGIALAFDRVFIAVGDALENPAEGNQLVQQADRERAGTDGGIEGAETVERFKAALGFGGFEDFAEGF